MYVSLCKSLYGTLQAAQVFWHTLGKIILAAIWSHPYDWFVLNNMINSKQFTVLWHVDGILISLWYTIYGYNQWWIRKESSTDHNTKQKSSADHYVWSNTQHAEWAVTRYVWGSHHSSSHAQILWTKNLYSHKDTKFVNQSCIKIIIVQCYLRNMAEALAAKNTISWMFLVTKITIATAVKLSSSACYSAKP